MLIDYFRQYMSDIFCHLGINVTNRTHVKDIGKSLEVTSTEVYKKCPRLKTNC